MRNDKFSPSSQRTHSLLDLNIYKVEVPESLLLTVDFMMESAAKITLEQWLTALDNRVLEVCSMELTEAQKEIDHKQLLQLMSEELH